MKIGPLDSKAPLAPVAGDRQTPAARGAKADASSEASATVALSAAAAVLAGKDNSGEFDSRKVQRISQAIRDGKFVVNADVIADKLIANAEELLGKASH